MGTVLGFLCVIVGFCLLKDGKLSGAFLICLGSGILTAIAS